MNDVFNIDFESDGTLCSYDLVVGNLPFNSANKKFVPALSQKHANLLHNTITKLRRKQSGHPSHTSVLNKYLRIMAFFASLLHLVKPDRAGIYELFCNTYTIHYLRIYNCQDANKIFRYNCQTPICYVMVQKMEYT